MNREEKIVYAHIEAEKGSPIKDFLTDEEINEALAMLADVLVALQVVDVYEIIEKARKK